MSPKDEIWLTIGEVASILGVSENTLRNWDATGRLRAKRHPSNNYRLYRESEVMSLVEEISPSEKYDIEDSSMEASESINPFSSIVRQLNRVYRDNDLDLMTRFEEISKILFCKFIDDSLANSLQQFESAFRINPQDSPDDVYQRINRLYRTHLPSSIEPRGGLVHKSKAVYDAARLLANSRLLLHKEDVKGIAYEEMIRNTFDGDENQQYFTPRQLVKFMINLVNPLASEIVCDPACGTGGFIVQCLKKIRQDSLSEDKIESEILELSKRNLIGIEVDSRMAWVAKMNSFAHGASPDCIHYLPQGGSLSYNNGSLQIIPDGSIDVIITNPPFGSDYTDSENLSQYISSQGKRSARRGVLFVERCIRALKPGGRMAIIVDDGILNSLSNQSIRELIIETSVIMAVLGLPEEMFQPYASVKASILLLKKKNSPNESQTPVFMVNIKRCGKKPNGNPDYTDERSANGHHELATDFPVITEMWERYLLGKEIDCFDEPQCFVTGLDLSETNPSRRLDTVFHDPSKLSAQKSLQNSHYPLYQLSEIFRLRNDTIIPAKTHSDEEIPYLSLSDIEKGTGKYTIESVNGSRIKSAVRKFVVGDILFAKMRPQLRKVILARDEGYCSSECLVLQSRFRTTNDSGQATLEEFVETEKDELRINTEYMSILLRSNLVYGQVMHHLTGIGRPRIPAREVMKVKVPIPPIEKQNLIVRHFRSQEEASMTLKKQAEQMIGKAGQIMRLAHEDAVESLGVISAK